VVMGNTMFIAATRALIEDFGGHGEGVIIKDNVGSLYPQEAVETTEAGLPSNIIINFDEELKAWFDC